VDRDVLVGVEGVDHEAVAREDGVLVLEVGENEVAVNLGAFLELGLELFFLLEIQVGPLGDVGELENFLERDLDAFVHEQHHQVVVGDLEIPEAAEAGARVHDEAEKHPALGLEDVGLLEIPRVHLVHGPHHVLVDLRELVLAEILEDDARAGGGVRVGDVVVLCADAFDLADMVVEGEVGALHVGKVGGDVAVRDIDLAVLHVLGVDERHFIDHVQAFE
jgi:hypothetical protein